MGFHVNLRRLSSVQRAELGCTCMQISRTRAWTAGHWIG
jgi:hypothetical protein